MKNNILIIFFILSSIGICLGQSLGVEYVSPKNITLRFDHIEVTDMNGNQIVKKSNTMIVYYPSGFTIVSDEEKIYTLDKDFFFSKYNDLIELVFYRVEKDKVKVKIAIPKYKNYVLNRLNIKK